ncbi:MAG: acyl-CoA dehydratase activase-related protein [Syntrophomonadaceae bacterium]|nr:acyl-CoA dehydratase activase-related protein [Syntrophomonadaceae bacterium]MDD3888685.1 acyl-CoA dehydratase activase-related protein [Syntrophomonadaceae bacterium]MDD4548498.1 acyl-CoA dehydratase activase-related protein [Syntrophomonadaceae bacterium]
MAKIGIPRTLAYFLYYPLWKTFFEDLNHEIVISPPTTRAILDAGVKEAVNDACIPIKLYHGHVAYLADKADYIFCPRLVSVRKHGDFGTETFCPKFLGLPDMIRFGIDHLPEIIDTRVDLKKGKKELFNVFCEIGSQIGNTHEEIKRAFSKALKVQKQFDNLLYQEILPPEAMDIVFNHKPAQVSHDNCDLTIAIIGYPYVLYDSYINAGLIRLLEKENVKILTQDMLSDKTMNRQAKTLPKSLFWYFSNRAVYGGLHFMARPDVDGIIHVTAFACGPDSLVDRMVEIEARRRRGMPYLSIAVDEHTGEAGVRTRIEAFLDMLRYRRDKI